MQYVETQGTGTRLGDAIEALALGNVLRDGRPADSPCAIGSVKTNLGHMEAASGVGSLMKAVLALEHRQLPPSLHFQTPSPDIPFDQLPLRVLGELEPWPESAGPRLAGVSALGFGGSNAHVVLQEAPAAAAGAALAPAGGDYLLPISARTEKARDELARRYVDFLRHDPPAWRDVCYTAARRREHHDCRLAVLAGSPAHAAELLEAAAGGQSLPGVFRGRKPYGRGLRIALLFDDRPENWLPHLEGLIDWIPGLAETLEQIDPVVQSTLGWSLGDRLKSGDGWGRPGDSRAALLALQCALGTWWRGVGITPSAVLGRGVGELAAACAAGILTMDEALRIVAAADGPAGAAPSVPAARAAALPFFSALDAQTHRGPELDAAHWQACLHGGPRWSEAVEALRQRQMDVYLEVGVGTLAPQIPKSPNPQIPKSPLSISTLTWPGQGGRDVLMAVGALYAAGADTAWSRIAPPDGRCVPAPNYPWQRQRLWAVSKPAAAAGPGMAPGPAAPTASPDGPEGAAPQPRPDLTAPYVAPRNALEADLAAAWAAVLRLDRVGIHDNFFELGGDSLMVTVLVNRLQQQLDMDLPLRDMYQSPTVAALAERLAAGTAEGKRRRRAPIVPLPREGPLTPSLTQEALWFLDQLERDRPTYTVYPALRIKGRLDLPVLERALNEILRRHEALRTRFPEIDGRPMQVVDPAEFRPLPLVDLSGLPAAQRQSGLDGWIAEEAERPINLQTGPLIRATLVRLSDEEHVLVAARTTSFTTAGRWR